MTNVSNVSQNDYRYFYDTSARLVYTSHLAHSHLHIRQTAFRTHSHITPVPEINRLGGRTNIIIKIYGKPLLFTVSK